MRPVPGCDEVCTKLPAARLYLELDANDSRLEHLEHTRLLLMGLPGSNALVLRPTVVSHFLRVPRPNPRVEGGPKLSQLPPRASRLALLSGLKSGASTPLGICPSALSDRLMALDSLLSSDNLIAGSLFDDDLLSCFLVALVAVAFFVGFWTDVTELVAAPISIKGARRTTSECRLGIPWTTWILCQALLSNYRHRHFSPLPSKSISSEIRRDDHAYAQTHAHTRAHTTQHHELVALIQAIILNDDRTSRPSNRSLSFLLSSLESHSGLTRNSR